MYFTNGYDPNEIGDFDVVAQDGLLHCFYLSLSSHDQIGHLTSNDGINWREEAVALRTGNPGDFDGDQIWTMGVYHFQSKWFMLYTALSQHGLMQTLGLATSDDLFHWEKYAGNPVITADERWYEANQSGNYRVDWRDPYIFQHEGKLHGFICARRKEGLLNRRGCAGYFTSEDGYHWEVQKPVATPANCYDYECPSIFTLDDRFYMVAIAGGPGATVYRVADRVEGPYLRPKDDVLLPSGNHSIRPCEWNGETLLFHWQRGMRDWAADGQGYAMLASPKQASTNENRQLVAQSFDWSPQYQGAAIQVNEATRSEQTCGEWQWENASLKSSAPAGAAIWLAETEYPDFILQAEATLPPKEGAMEFGLVLRAGDQGDTGLFASCIPGRFCGELVKYVYNRTRGPESLHRGRSVVQHHHLAPAEDGRYTLSIVAFGPSIEFNVNGRLILATMSLPRRAGQLGLFAEEGEAVFSNIVIQPLREPNCHWQ